MALDHHQLVNVNQDPEPVVPELTFALWLEGRLTTPAAIPAKDPITIRELAEYVGPLQRITRAWGRIAVKKML